MQLDHQLRAETDGQAKHRCNELFEAAGEWPYVGTSTPWQLDQRLVQIVYFSIHVHLFSISNLKVQIADLLFWGFEISPGSD